MNKDLTLVIMAAGMGSRFGGLKQIEPVGPNGEFIIDYSIYDAIKAGFNKVVFIIKKSFEKEFKETIGKRVEGKIKVEYAYQEMDDVPEGTIIPEGREKPFGTGHALYTARNYIHEPFAVISADDFYGTEAFQDLGVGLQNTNNYIIIGYQIGSTLTENGSVKRGVIFEEDGHLKKIVESKVEKVNGVIEGSPLDGSEGYTVEDDHPVSMLMYGLRPEAVDYVSNDIKNFFKTADLTQEEYFLPNVLNDIMNNGNPFKVVRTKAKWKGVTYATDLQELKDYIKELINQGIYPENLWK
ncbi:MAG: nucleotidyltransferase [Firmicutes bacterium]|nr:nucleotidyltransferase [Bacillota bacterium]